MNKRLSATRWATLYCKAHSHSRAASAIKVVIDSDSSDEGGEKVKFVAKKGADAKENKKNALYARFVNVSAKQGQI